MLLVALYMSTTDESVDPSGEPPPNATISPIDAAARYVRF
jgi:hypothetical protein